MGAAMIHMLEEKFQELGFQPSWLNLSHAAGQEAFIAVLNEALHQQRSSHAAFTHRLLQLAQAQGWLKTTSAAVNLSPWDEIHRLWQQVEKHPDPTIQAKGRDGIRKHSQQTAEALQLQAALIAYCRAAGWKPQHLGVAGSPASIGLDQALLEIIECRDRGATELSQKLIEQCEALGCSSPWLLDNRARLLQGRDPEAATTIWNDLLNDADPQVRRSAQMALDQNQSPETEDALERAISDAKDRGLNTPWRPLLLRRLLEDDAVDSACWRQQAAQLPHHDQAAWDLHLRRHRLFHALVDEQLNQLEQTTSNR